MHNTKRALYQAFLIFFCSFFLVVPVPAQSFLSLSEQDPIFNQQSDATALQINFENVSKAIEQYQYGQTYKSLQTVSRFDLKKSGYNTKFDQLVLYLYAAIYFDLAVYDKVIEYTTLYLDYFPKNTPILLLQTEAKMKLGSVESGIDELSDQRYFGEAQRYGKNIEKKYRSLLFHDSIENREFKKAIEYASSENGVIQNDYVSLINEHLIQNPLVQFINASQSNDIFNLIKLEDQEVQFTQEATFDADKTINEDEYQEAKPLKVGVVLPLQHKSLKGLSHQIILGIKLALWQRAQFNDRKIELVIRNYPINPDKKNRVVEKLIKNERVDIILGPLTKGAALKAAQIAKKFQIPLISYSLTENIGKDNPFSFRFQRSKNEESKLIARFAYHYLNAERIAVLYQNNAESFHQAKTFWHESKKQGAEIVAFEKIGTNIKEYRSVYRKITGQYKFLTSREKEANLQQQSSNKNLGIDAIYLPVTLSKFLQLESFMDAYDLNHVKILLNSEANTPQIFNLDKKNNIYFTDSYHNTFEMQEIHELYQRFFSVQNSSKYFSSYTFYAYLSVMMLSELMKNEQNITVQLLNKKRIEFGDYSLDINKHGDITSKIFILSPKGNNSHPYF